MDSNTMLVVISIIVAIVVIVLLVLVIRRSQVIQLPKSKELSKSADVGRASISTHLDPEMSMQPDIDPSFESGERQAAPVSELIEEMVKQKLQEYPDLHDVVIDFGTSSDGSLEIWIDSERYLDVEEIPDRRIREAIAESIDDFNA